MNQLTIIFAAFLGILVFTLPRKYFLLPFIIAACFVPADQRIIIFDLDFTPLRMLVLVGFLRTFIRGERLRFKWNRFDKLVLAWAICGAVVYVIQWANMRVLIYKCGVLFDILGLYWIFRQSIRSWQDINFLVKILAMFALVSSVFIVLERVTHNNLFDILGKVETGIHRGRYRCRGPFPHAIMMGLFWANVVPFFMAYVMDNRSRALYVVAIICSLICVALSGSSTPIMTVMFVICAFALYRFRMYGKQVAWGFCLMMLALHIVMQAPVWHLISRFTFFSGSTGWHRYHLIDKAIAHFNEWVFLGCRSSAHWGLGLQDITNQYILEGVRGGFVTLMLFVLFLVYTVNIPGSYSLRCAVNYRRWLSWGICISILGHCISFFGVSYFGQITMLLYLTFAIVSFVAENALVSVENTQPVLNKMVL